MGKPYTNREMKRIQELAGQLTPQQIGNIIGRTGASVREFAARHNISLSMKYNKPGYHEAEQIVRMKAEGYSFAKIGAALGLSKTTTCLFTGGAYEENSITLGALRKPRYLRHTITPPKA